MSFTKISNSAVAARFDTYPEKIRKKLLFLRQLILDTASSIEEVGDLEETLKWGEPSYLTTTSKSGSTIRINKMKTGDDLYAIYFKCTADLVPAFRGKYPDEFIYEKNRAITFHVSDEIPVGKLKSCIALALTYHLNKKMAPDARWEFVKNLTER